MLTLLFWVCNYAGTWFFYQVECIVWTSQKFEDNPHPWGNAPGAVANRVALEACTQARNEGRDLAREGGDVIRSACKWSPELAAACEVWKEIKFEFETIDKL
jgi:hypothetical protein